MAVVLPIIRLCLLSSNIWITYKRLKKPRLRNGERNSRHLQARRRELKSCLQVWVLWGICLAVEPVFDRSISFLPFYTTTKSILWSTLLLTRSIVAEPIYIHFLRPFIKPYGITIDLFLDLIHALGELILEIILMPFNYFHKLWRSWRTTNERTSDSDSIDTTAEDPGRPVTRSQTRGADSVEYIPERPSTRQTRSQTILRKKASAQSIRASGSNMASGVLRGTNTSVHSETHSSYQFVDPRTLTDDEPRRARLRTRRSNLKEVGYNTPFTSEAGFVGNLDPPKEIEHGLVTSHPSTARSHSDSAIPIPVHPIEENNTISPWAGVYPPLPAAYPASPVPPRPVSLPPIIPPGPTYTVPAEPYPAFPSAYPVTPAVRPLSLHPNFSSGVSGHLFASMGVHAQNMLEENEKNEEADQDTKQPDAVPISLEQSPGSQVTATVSRGAIALVDGRPVPNKPRDVSTSDLHPNKAVRPLDTRRVVSATMSAAINLATSEEQPSTRAVIQPEPGTQHYRTKSAVPQKRSVRGEAATATKVDLESDSHRASTSHIVDQEAAVNDDDESIKRRKVSREASNEGQRVSRESSQDRISLAKARKRTQQANRINSDERRSRDSVRGRPKENLIRSDYSSRTSTISTGSRSTRSSASASASEAYQITRRRAT